MFPSPIPFFPSYRPFALLGEDHLVEVHRQEGEHSGGQHHHAFEKKRAQVSGTAKKRGGMGRGLKMMGKG